MSHVAAIVPAAGSGSRFGGRTSKPFALLRDAPLLLHTLTALQASPAIRWIVPAVRAGDASQVVALLKRYKITKALAPCRGGNSRAESVARAFAAVPNAARWVLVHDGARPCVSPQLIAQAVRAGKRFGAAVCGLPASLTVKAVDDRGEIRLTLDRDQLWFVQTPQVFRRDWFAQALEHANHGLDRFPDDAAIVEGAGFPVRVIAGDPFNIKVTTQEDLVLAEAILVARGSRLKAQGNSLQPRAYSLEQTR